MTTKPVAPQGDEGTSWQFYLVIAVIAIGVLMILFGALGIL